MTSFICTLPKKVQREIRRDLEQVISEEWIEIAMYSRLCDLEDVINVKKYTKEEM